MQAKDWISILGILATLGVAVSNLIVNIRNNKITTYINTVTAARIDWIENLRDKISSFIALAEMMNAQLSISSTDDREKEAREFDTLLHQIVLYLNPSDPVDRRIRELVTESYSIATGRRALEELGKCLTLLRDATGAYLHKEWKKVKDEAKHELGP
jgi:hypothetical protein